MSFESLGLSAALLRSIGEEGYETATPVQEQAIPTILAGRDIMAAAQTGTGKTAGFTLPMLDRLMASAAGGRRRPVRALVLTPTRELAAQVQTSVRTYGRHLPLRSAAVFGGVGMQPQVQALRGGTDILVATPGRLMDHMQRGTADLSRVEFLVLDEADRMLDMGFINDIRRIIRALPEKRQTLLFSATLSNEIRRLADGLLDQPVRIEIASRNSAAETVTQTVHPVSRDSKRALLSNLIRTGDWKQVLVFTRTKHGADRLVKQLDQDEVAAAAIHGNKSQGARTRALDRFKQGRVRVLVATDIAARGLDIEQLPYVVNYELPNTPEDYVHRIGRTGRAGHGGQARSLVCADEGGLLRGIERMLKKDIDKQVIPGFEPDPTERPQPLFNKPAGRRPNRPNPGNGRRSPAQSGRRSSGARQGR